jgi:hypothetical protein
LAREKGSVLPFAAAGRGFIEPRSIHAGISSISSVRGRWERLRIGQFQRTAKSRRDAGIRVGRCDRSAQRTFRAGCANHNKSDCAVAAEIHTVAGFQKLIEPTAVDVREKAKDGVAWLATDFDNPLDEEHVFSVLLHDGQPLTVTVSRSRGISVRGAPFLANSREIVRNGSRLL